MQASLSSIFAGTCKQNKLFGMENSNKKQPNQDIAESCYLCYKYIAIFPMFQSNWGKSLLSLPRYFIELVFL
jgi:hypothetical protein